MGAATTCRLHVVIEPKLAIDRVFFLLGYARRLRFAAPTTLAARKGIVEPFVTMFLDDSNGALRRGLPMSYVSREEHFRPSAAAFASPSSCGGATASPSRSRSATTTTP